MSGVNTNVNANINWPLVAGLGVAAAVLFYALYIVNNQLQQADQLVGGASSDVQAVLSPIAKAFNWVGSLFDSSTSTADDGTDGQAPNGGTAF
jgi:hypothetical protein